MRRHTVHGKKALGIKLTGDLELWMSSEIYCSSLIMD